MKSLFQPISNSAEAEKVINDASLLLLILVGLQLLVHLPTENQSLIWKPIMWDIVEIFLISMLRWYRKTTFCVLLILMFLLTLFPYIKYLLTSSGGIVTIIEFVLSIYICVRAWQATRIIQGKSKVISHFISHGYKWYSVIFLATMIATYIDIFVNNRATTIDYFDIPISLPGMFGLLGYTFKKQILNISTWKIYLIVIVVWDIIGLSIHPQQNSIIDISLTAKIVSTISIIIFMLPYYRAIYLYGYSSKQIWNKKPHNKTLNADSGNSPAAG